MNRSWGNSLSSASSGCWRSQSDTTFLAPSIDVRNFHARIRLLMLPTEFEEIAKNQISGPNAKQSFPTLSFPFQVLLRLSSLQFTTAFGNFGHLMWLALNFELPFFRQRLLSISSRQNWSQSTLLREVKEP